MIRITCTSCQNVLNIDDAFAGGVCRCQHCGTIQTVPAHLKGSAERAEAEVQAGTATVAESTTNGKASKTLYENKPRSGMASESGLDSLADIVASSGLGSRRLRAADGSIAVVPPEPDQQKKTRRLLIAAGALIVLLLLLVMLLILRGKGNASQNTGGPDVLTGGSGNPGGPSIPMISGPSFCGIKLDENVVVYLIDNGSSSEHLLDFMKGAVYHSVESIGSERKFQMLFWNPESPGYPDGSQPVYATRDDLEAARKKLDEVISYGKTDLQPAMKKAMEANPGEIVIISAKADDLDDALVDAVIAIRGSSPVKIDAVAITDVPMSPNAVLPKIAAKSGGKFTTISESQLRSIAY